MQPDYFLYRMQWWEVNRYIAGIHRRHRNAWMNTRHLEWFLACMFSGKEGKTPKTAEEMYKFAWEEQQPTTPQITEEEALHLQEEIKNFKW